MLSLNSYITEELSMEEKVHDDNNVPEIFKNVPYVEELFNGKFKFYKDKDKMIYCINECVKILGKKMFWLSESECYKEFHKIFEEC